MIVVDNLNADFRLSMIFVHLLLHLLLHLFPHLSFEDGDPDGSIISSYLRRCVSLGIVLHRVSSLFIFLISTQFLILKLDHYDFSLAPLLHCRFR